MLATHAPCASPPLPVPLVLCRDMKIHALVETAMKAQDHFSPVPGRR